MRKAVIYARFSPRRNAETCESVETQIQFCESYCTMRDLDYVASYSDKAVSGKSTKNRPGLADAIQRARQEQAVLVVYSLSRLSRNVADCISIEDRVGDLVSIKEDINTTTAMGRFMFNIVAAMAQLEREQVGERTSDAMQQHQANGRVMSKQLPYGMMLDPVDNSKMVPCHREQVALEYMKGWREDGMSYRAIAAMLEDIAIKPRGDKWHPGSIRRILEAQAHQ